MPPVLGPLFPSKMRLWSWPDGSDLKVLPSQKVSRLISSPCMNSSITTELPASPNLTGRKNDTLAGGQAVDFDDHFCGIHRVKIAPGSLVVVE